MKSAISIYIVYLVVGGNLACEITGEVIDCLRKRGIQMVSPHLFGFFQWPKLRVHLVHLDGDVMGIFSASLRAASLPACLASSLLRPQLRQQ